MRVRDVHAPRDGDCRVILLKIDPGRETPRHTHGGVELTCVLSGAYATETTRFDVGDLEEADESGLAPAACRLGRALSVRRRPRWADPARRLAWPLDPALRQL